MIQSLKELPNKTLVEVIMALKGRENITQAHIIRYLLEIDERKLFRELGYSSLFTYCTEGLGYSPGAAYVRVQAAKCLKDNPEIFALIRDGKMSICSVAEISKIPIQSVKTELLQEALGKTKVEESELDNIKPFVLGGDNSVDNLRLLCRAHNQLFAEKVFGKLREMGAIPRIN